MDETIFITFSTNDYLDEIQIEFLVKLSRLESGKISGLTIENKEFITCSLKFKYESSDIDNVNFIFNQLYFALKDKNKQFLIDNLDEKELTIIWRNRKPLKKLIKKLRQKYPELKYLTKNTETSI